MGRAGCWRLENEYDPDRLTAELLSLYSGLVESQQHRPSHSGLCTRGPAMFAPTDSINLSSARGSARDH